MTINRVITNQEITVKLINEVTEEFKTHTFTMQGEPTDSAIKHQMERYIKLYDDLNGFEFFKIVKKEKESPCRYSMDIEKFVSNAQKVEKRTLGRYISKNIEFTVVKLITYQRDFGTLFEEEKQIIGKVKDEILKLAKEYDFMNREKVLVDYEIKETHFGLYEMPELTFMELADKVEVVEIED